MSMSPVSFKGVYKVTMPKVTDATSEQEKNAYTDTAINVTVMASNASIAEPKVSSDSKSVYFKIDDRNDAKFEKGFKDILADCNKRFHVDMAKKAYITKVDEAEYQNAQAL